MTHPCENKCPNYQGEQCSTCMIHEDVEGIDMRDALDQVLDEVAGEGEPL